MIKAEKRRAFRDARRSYLFEGGKGAGRLSPLLDPDFDSLPDTPYQYRLSGEPLDLVEVFKLQGL
jgi:hypothetical protein